MPKKALCLALVLITITACFISCGETADTAPIAVTEAVETELYYLDTLPDTDYEGYNFNIIASYLYNNFPEETLNGEVVNDALYNRNQAINERYNIVIKCENIGTSESDGTSKVIKMVNQSVLANDGSYDILIVPMMTVMSALTTNGLLFDLKSLPYLQLEENWWCKTVYDNMQLNGKLFCSTGAVSPCFFYTPYVISYNMRLAENYGINNIYDLVLDGKWTFDRLTELMKDVSSDLDGDGKMGQYDLYAMSLEDVAGYGYYVSAGNKFTDRDDDGTPNLSNMISEKSINFIDKAAAVLGDKSISLRGEDFPKADDLMKYSGTVFAEGRSLFNSTSMDALIISGRKIEDDYGIIPCPKNDESQTEYYAFANPWVNSAIAVPYDCKDSERTGLILESLAYLSYETVRPAVYDVMLKEKIARDEKTQQILDIIYKNVYYDLNSSFNFADSFSLVRAYVLGEDKGSIVSAYEKIREKAETAIATLMETINTLQ